MDKKRILFIGKWAAIIILGSMNFLSFLVNETTLNLIVVIAVFLYSIYEFFQTLSKHNLHLGIKMYLFSYYLFAAVVLVLGLRSLAIGNVNSFLLSLLFIAGDIALIIYTLHKLSEYKN